MAFLASRLFGTLVAARDRAYGRGWLHVRRLTAPVVSVGNLSVGGSGKTPAVIALARALTAHGLRVDVLTRGYGRIRREPVIVAPGAILAAAEAGDEPLLIAASAQVPVLVDADRYRSGAEGERRFGTQIHLLDDGFQHRQLARAFDLVLVRAADLREPLLPAGRLREPPSALARASAVLAVDESSGCDWTAHTTAPVFQAFRRGRPPAVVPRRPLAFCGLARPDSFWRTLAELQIHPAATVAFRDHHRYTPADALGLRERAARAGADGFLTTAKDAVKLDGLDLEPLAVVGLELEIAGLDRLLALIREACGL